MLTSEPAVMCQSPSPFFTAVREGQKAAALLSLQYVTICQANISEPFRHVRSTAAARGFLLQFRCWYRLDLFEIIANRLLVFLLPNSVLETFFPNLSSVACILLITFLNP